MVSASSLPVSRPLLGVLASVVVGVASPCVADLTLVYGTGSTGEATGTATHQVHVSEGKVSIANTGNRRLLIYDSASDKAVIVDHQAKQVFPLQRQEVEKMAETYLETQRQVLADLERRIRDLSVKEQDALRSMMDVLHAGIEISVSDGETEGELVELEKREAVAGIEASVGEFRARGGDRLLERVWVVAPSRVQLTPGDLQALQGLDLYFARLNRGLPAGLRKELGELRFLDEQGRLILRRESLLGADGKGAALEVRRIDHDPIEPGWFEIPAKFPESSLLGPPEAAAEKASEP